MHIYEYLYITIHSYTQSCTVTQTDFVYRWDHHLVEVRTCGCPTCATGANRIHREAPKGINREHLKGINRKHLKGINEDSSKNIPILSCTNITSICILIEIIPYNIWYSLYVYKTSMNNIKYKDKKNIYIYGCVRKTSWVHRKAVTKLCSDGGSTNIVPS